MFLAGERCDPNTLEWTRQQVHCPVFDHYWQSETGWPMVMNPGRKGLSVPIKPGSSALPVPGWDVRIMTSQMTPAQPHQV
jgi:propionyl-CoA synthetase